MEYEHGPITKVDLLERTKLKQTTLTRMMDELLGRKIIRECGFAESSGGRPPILYEVDAGGHYIVGVDLSPTQTRVVLVDIFFRQLATESVVMTSEHTPERTIYDSRESFKDLWGRIRLKWINC